MARTADIVIVGGGVVGSSIAYHLTRNGVRDIVVLEANRLASGTTGKGAGGIRCQYDTDLEIVFSRESRAFYANAATTIGDSCDFRPVGFLYLLRSEEELAARREMAERAARLGVTMRILSAEETLSLIPGLNSTGVLGGAFTPEDGTASPPRAARAFAARATEMGAQFVEGAPLVGATIDTSGSRPRLEQVITPDGPIATRVAVLAVGAWIERVGALLGLRLPVTPSKRHIVALAPVPWGSTPVPMTIDLTSGFYFRTEDDRLLVSSGEAIPTDDFSTTVEDAWETRAVGQARALLPALVDASVVARRAGLREMTPDGRAYLGETHIDGLYVASGFSGHGFMHAPYTGQVMAELITRGVSPVDLSPLRPERFADR